MSRYAEHQDLGSRDPDHEGWGIGGPSANLPMWPPGRGVLNPPVVTGPVIR